MKRTYLKLAAIFIMSLAMFSCEKDEEIENAEPVNSLTDGYVLYAFMKDYTTHLIDTSGNDVKTWSSSYESTGGYYLSSNKTLLRLGTTIGAGNGSFTKGGAVGGIIEEIDDNNDVIWSFQKDDDEYTLHHDFKEIDSNTIIALSWNVVEYNGNNHWNERIIIVDKTSNSIIWEWSAITDGELIPSKPTDEDYLHFNSVDYNNGKILVSARSKNMLYLIDKESKTIVSTFTAEGTLSGQHDATFLENGNILAYNNVAEANKSSVVELSMDDEIIWEYSNDFFSDHISGTCRLESGNTLICSGVEPRFIEVTEDGTEVWDYTPTNANAPRGNVFKIRKYSEY